MPMNERIDQLPSSVKKSLQIKASSLIGKGPRRGLPRRMEKAGHRGGKISPSFGGAKGWGEEQKKEKTKFYQGK